MTVWELLMLVLAAMNSWSPHESYSDPEELAVEVEISEEEEEEESSLVDSPSWKNNESITVNPLEEHGFRTLPSMKLRMNRSNEARPTKSPSTSSNWHQILQEEESNDTDCKLVMLNKNIYEVFRLRNMNYTSSSPVYECRKISNNSSVNCVVSKYRKLSGLEHETSSITLVTLLSASDCKAMVVTGD